MTTTEQKTGADGPCTTAFKAFCAGDRTRFFSVLPRLLLGPARKIARKSGSIFGDTDDLIQEALLRANRRSGRWESKDHMFSWLCRALRSASIDARRRHREAGTEDFSPRTFSLLDRDDLEAGDRPGLAPIERIAIANAVDRLRSERPNAFRVTELRWWGVETLSQRQVATLLKIKPHDVRRLERIARDFLYRELN